MRNKTDNTHHFTQKIYPLLMKGKYHFEGTNEEEIDWSVNHSIKQLHQDLIAFNAACKDAAHETFSFVALLPNLICESKSSFENELWNLLKSLRSLDSQDSDMTLSCDLTNDLFTMSIGDVPLYIVGMHPYNFKSARHALFPTIVFNHNEDLETLANTNFFIRNVK